MASLFEVLPAALLACLFWTGLGWLLARRVFAPPVSLLGVAPMLGWAVHTALALPLLRLIGFHPASVIGVALMAVILAGWAGRAAPIQPVMRLPRWLPAAAFALAALPAMAILPKIGPGSVALSGPIFDHVKVAIIDEIGRLGLPPGNPFLAGGGPRLAYYYVWHASAAELAQVLPIGGWAADAALTWFTGFASLMLMAGLAAGLSGKPRAASWALALSLPGSMRPLLHLAGNSGQWLLPATGLGGWLNQASWAPQHVASAGAVVLASLLLARLANTTDLLTPILLAGTVAAAFGSSTWVGGVTFAIAAPLIAIAVAWRLPPPARLRFAGRCAVAAMLTLILIAPLLRDQLAAAARRGAGWPVAFGLYPVFQPLLPGWLNAPGFALLMLIELPAIAVMAALGARRRMISPPYAALAATGVAALLVACVLRSTIDNNDLGWRAILPALLILTPLAAAASADWFGRAGWRRAMVVALPLLGVSGAAGIVKDNLRGTRTESAPAFAASADLWAAVRSVAGPADRVASDPLLFADMTAWPANISWALLADRPSCYSGWATAHPFVPIPGAELYAIDGLFRRVFDGTATQADMASLTAQFSCRIAVVTQGDGAWNRDPFAANARWHLVSQRPDRWRIYRTAP